MTTKKVKKMAFQEGFFVCAPNGAVYFVYGDLTKAPKSLGKKEECKEGVDKIFGCLNRIGYYSDMVVLSGVQIKANGLVHSKRPVGRPSAKK